jgi:hypothetical protein
MYERIGLAVMLGALLCASTTLGAGTDRVSKSPHHHGGAVSRRRYGGSSVPLAAREQRGVLGQQIVIENRAGARADASAPTVLRSPPDGYTVLCAPS